MAKANIASGLADSETERKYLRTSQVTGNRIRSDYEKLKRRVKREFVKKRFVGDIAITDSEFAILVDYLKYFYEWLRVLDWDTDPDIMICTVMVQIGIRYYDGAYWPHFVSVLGDDSWSNNHQAVLGKICIGTLKEYGKYVVSDSDRINSILMHGFVSDKYAPNLFDFLFAYYRIDLDRDLSRNDRETMREFIRTIQSKDNSGRTYKLVRHTSDAVVKNPRGCTTRLRWILKKIDASFWGDEVHINPNNRLSRLFSNWMGESKDFQYYSGGRGSRQRIYSSPHIFLEIENGNFFLQLPTQIIRSCEDVHWTYDIDGTVKTLAVDAFESVLGYKTDPVRLFITAKDIFNRLSFELCYGDDKKRFYIPQEDIRFFNRDGYSVAAKNLKPGEYYAFTRGANTVESNALIEERKVAGTCFYYFSFEEGDIVKLPDGRAVSIGKRIQEGLLSRGLVKGVHEIQEGYAVYSQVPSILFKTLPKRLPGTAITVNGKKSRLMDECELTEIELDDGSKEFGYWFSLTDLGCDSDGIYKIDLDVPNDRSVRNWAFALIKDLEFSFEGTVPYVYESKGTICFSGWKSYQIQPLDSRIEKDNEKGYYNFEIKASQGNLPFTINQVGISIDVPQFEYSFNGEDWYVEQYPQIWHTDFPRKVWIRYPELRITLELDNRQPDFFDTEESFDIRKSDGVFECDLTRFRSWFNQGVVRNELIFKSQCRQFPFLDVVVRSYVSNCTLTADIEKNLLQIHASIIGKSRYYVDLYYKKELIKEKIALENDLGSVEAPVKTGKYRIEIFEEDSTDDFSFDDIAYQKIYSASEEIINPSDLTGKSVELIAIKRDEKGIFSRYFSHKYIVRSLQLVQEGDPFSYTGTLTDTRRPAMSLPIMFELMDLQNLRFAHIHWIDQEYGDILQFLYDKEERTLVCEEEKTLSSSEKYRRYDCLFMDMFLFEYRFVTN